MGMELDKDLIKKEILRIIKGSDVKQSSTEVKEMAKSLYKSILKSLHNRRKKEAKDIVNDVLDPNFEAEIDPDALPSRKDGVLMKNKLKSFLDKKNQKKQAVKVKKECASTTDLKKYKSVKSSKKIKQ